LAGGDQDRCSNQILRYISALRYARQPKIAPVMNKMGYLIRSVSGSDELALFDMFARSSTSGLPSACVTSKIC
jgi:hypothetical protein